MENLKAKYDKILSQRKNLTEQINILANDENVRKYLELNKQKEELAKEQKKLYRKVKYEDYSSCNHIWVTTLSDYDSSEGRSYYYHGCIKCGLDKSLLRLSETFCGGYCNGIDMLTPSQRIMYDFMSTHSCGYGIYTNLLCDLDLAKAIYAKIKAAHPNVDDETAIKYLKVAIHNIKNIKVSEERKANRAQRLSLKPEFNRWPGLTVRR